MACYHFTIKTNEKPNGGCVDAANHADYINREGKYKDIDNKVLSSAHADYINRNDKFAYRGGCVFHAHHLPNWADNSPKKFFNAADKYEGKNSVTYREIEFALPEELSLNQNKEIINQFLNNHLKDFYYNYAIHDKQSTMAEGHKNMHVHIMFSERKIDENERAQEKAPDVFFKKANRNNPQAGGCKKDPKWNGKERAKYLFTMRKDFADIQNKALEKHGFEVRVDHRTLAAQRESALQKGDTVLAKILDRLPEKHIGPSVAASPNHPEVIALKKYRAAKHEHQKLIYASNILAQGFIADNIKETTHILTQNIDSVIQDSQKLAVKNSFKNILSFDENRNLSTLQANIISLSKEILTVKPFVYSYTEALDKVKESYLEPEENLLINECKYINNNKQKYEYLDKKLSLLQTSSPNEYNKNDHIEIKERIADLKKNYSALLPNLRSINEKLSSQKMKSLLSKSTNAFLEGNKYARENLTALNNQLDANIKELRNFIDTMISRELEQFKQKSLQNPDDLFIKSANNKTHFSAQEILNTINTVTESYQIEIDNCKHEISALESDIKKLSPKIFTKARAISMAKNTFTKGQYKSLRQQEYTLKKDESVLNTKTFNAVTDKYKMEILTNKKQILNDNFAKLDEYCSQHKDKINLIATNILKNNKPIAAYFNDVQNTLLSAKNRLVNLQIGYKDTSALKQSVQLFVKHDQSLKHEKGTITYAVKSKTIPQIPITSSNKFDNATDYKKVSVNTHTQEVGQKKTATSPIKLIAAAMNSNKNPATIVARLDDKYNEFEWVGLTEIDKKIKIDDVSRKSMEMGI